jgi:hypothetical protein
MNNPNQVFIIGGGYSIKPHLKELQSKLKDKFVIALNYAYKDFPNATFISYIDICNDYEEQKRFFYNSERENLKSYPLIIGRSGNKRAKIYPNVILLKENSKEYTRDLSKGVYKHSLVGIWALSLGIYLLDIGEICLFGYDYGIKGDNTKMTQACQFRNFAEKNSKGEYISHYNQDKIKHSGLELDKLAYYYSHTPEKQFGVFKKENKVKIWNVSLESRIPESIFEKLSYEDFFKKINKKKYNQNELRKWVKYKISLLNPSIITPPTKPFK